MSSSDPSGSNSNSADVDLGRRMGLLFLGESAASTGATSSTNWDSLQNPMSGSTEGPQASRSYRFSRFFYDLLDCNIPIFDPADVEIGDFIGAGATMKVSKATLKGQAVAVKEFSFRSSPTENKEGGFSDSMLSHQLQAAALEARVLSMPQIRAHRNVVKLLGATWRNPWNAMLVVELAIPEHPTLEQFLPTVSPTDLRTKTGLIRDIISGLAALHDIRVVHGDLKPENVLLFRDTVPDRVVAKLSDFGFCQADITSENFSGGTSYWSAPECLDEKWRSILAMSTRHNISLMGLGNNEGDFPRDIYSFGLLALCILTGRKPFGPDRGEWWAQNEGQITKSKLGNAVQETSAPVLLSSFRLRTADLGTLNFIDMFEHPETNLMKDQEDKQLWPEMRIATFMAEGYKYDEAAEMARCYERQIDLNGKGLVSVSPFVHNYIRDEAARRTHRESLRNVGLNALLVEGKATWEFRDPGTGEWLQCDSLMPADVMLLFEAVSKNPFVRLSASEWLARLGPCEDEGTGHLAPNAEDPTTVQRFSYDNALGSRNTSGSAYQKSIRDIPRALWSSTLSALQDEANLPDATDVENMLIGDCVAKGFGTSPDRVASLRWFWRSATQAQRAHESNIITPEKRLDEYLGHRSSPHTHILVKMRQQTYLQERSRAFEELPLDLEDQDEDPERGIISLSTEEDLILGSIIFVQGNIDIADRIWGGSNERMADNMIHRLKAMFSTLEQNRRISLLRAAFYRYCYSARDAWEADELGNLTRGPLKALRNLFVCGTMTNLGDLMTQVTKTELKSLVDESLIREMAITSKAQVMDKLVQAMSADYFAFMKESRAFLRGGFEEKRSIMQGATSPKRCPNPSTPNHEPHDLYPALYATILYDNLSALLFFLSHADEDDKKGADFRQYLVLAAMSCLPFSVAGFLSIGVDVNGSLQSLKQTPLMAACSAGMSKKLNAAAQHEATCWYEIDWPQNGNIYHGTPEEDVRHRQLMTVTLLLQEPNIDLSLRGSFHGMQAIHFAVLGGNEEVVRKLLDKGVDPNSPCDAPGGRPLVIAITESRNVNVVRVLLEAGADVEASGGGSPTPLMTALMLNLTAIVELLLEHGAKVGKCSVADPEGGGMTQWTTHVHLATSDESVQLLVQAGADVEAVDENNLTPLEQALKAEDFEQAAVLLRYATRIACDCCKSLVHWTDFHYHCDICDGGDFDCCRSCFDARETCPGENHKMAARRRVCGEFIAVDLDQEIGEGKREVEKGNSGLEREAENCNAEDGESEKLPETKRTNPLQVSKTDTEEEDDTNSKEKLTALSGETDNLAEAYVKSSGVSARKYLDLYARKMEEIQDDVMSFWKEERFRQEGLLYCGSDKADGEESKALAMLTASELAIEHLQTEYPYAKELMMLISLFDHARLSREFFPLAVKHLEANSTCTWDTINHAPIPAWYVSAFASEGKWNEAAFLEIAGRLTSFRLVKESADSSGYEINPLLQDWLLLKLSESSRSELFKETLFWLFNALPGGPYPGCYVDNRFDLTSGQWYSVNPTVNKEIRDTLVLPHIRAWSEAASRFSFEKDYQVLEILKAVCLCENSSQTPGKIREIAEQKQRILTNRGEGESAAFFLDGFDRVVGHICDLSKLEAVLLSQDLYEEAQERFGNYHPISIEATVHLLNSMSLIDTGPKEQILISLMQSGLDQTMAVLHSNPHLLFLGSESDCIQLVKRFSVEAILSPFGRELNKTIHEEYTRMAKSLACQSRHWYNRAMLLAKSEKFNSAGRMFAYLAQLDNAIVDSELEVMAKSEMARLLLIKNLSGQAEQAFHLLQATLGYYGRLKPAGNYVLTETLQRLGFAYCLNNDGMNAMAVFVEYFLQQWLSQTKGEIASNLSLLREKHGITVDEDTGTNLTVIKRWASSNMVVDMVQDQEALRGLITEFKGRPGWAVWSPLLDRLFGSFSDDIKLLERKAVFCAFMMVSMYCDWDELRNKWVNRPTFNTLEMSTTPGGFLAKIGKNDGDWDARYLYLRTV